MNKLKIYKSNRLSEEGGIRMELVVTQKYIVDINLSKSKLVNFIAVQKLLTEFENSIDL